MFDTMQYRDYIFPHNPAGITVSRPDGAAIHFCPGRGEVIQDLGGRGRTVKCSGCFFGGTLESAAAQLERFRRVVPADGLPGMLILPGEEPFQAHLREFVYEQSGDGRIIPYTMVFAETEETA